ncbi:SNARE-associated protein-related isoform 2 [Cucumis melo var. makuwa]|uniref:Biogenesis of lysosome-related organelles complex 1 subunit 7 n=1 Tax=Cucumis melo var. makuwa TaxID=1194695 RepID=A0A5A7UCW4_CUCMM|nr:SNARE-associated protein-related isoform 2 [Cucumis melo var. makuwa]TYK01880.1 SNARE-associated protein-related isoform 2 [Cucumis melo var. makuwa]
MHRPEKLDDDYSANEDSNVSAELETSISPIGDLQEGNDGENKNLGNSNALANGLSSMLINIIRDFDSKADDTLKSQNHLSSSLDRLTTELDQLLEDAPFPFIMQHASRISNDIRCVDATKTDFPQEESDLLGDATSLNMLIKGGILFVATRGKERRDQFRSKMAKLVKLPFPSVFC